MRYNSNVIPREINESDLALKRVMEPTRTWKVLPKWERSYQIRQELPHDAYNLEDLDGQLFPETWNLISLIYYYN